MSEKKQKLELTWIGKEKRQRYNVKMCSKAFLKVGIWCKHHAQKETKQ